MPHDVSPPDIDAARLEALRKAYAAGKRLSAEQLVEIGKGPAPAKADEFALQADDPAGYSKSYQQYASDLPIWEASTSIESRVRTIKRWVKAGREHTPRPDYPPFDHPEQLAAWWTRVKRRQVPALLLAIAAPPGSAPAATAPTVSATTTAPSPSAPTIDVSTMVALGPAERIEQMRRLVNARFQLYQDALAAGAGDAEIKGRAYRELSAELRNAERDTESLRERTGELIPRDSIKVELQRLHTAIASCFRAALAPLACSQEEKERVLAEAFRPLRDANFGLDATAPTPARLAA